MKKYLFQVLLILFVLLVTFHLGISSVSAQTVEEGMVDTTIIDTTLMPQSIPTESRRIDYELPYPGMLPDNPFYFLKTARDRIVKFLINDSLQRAKFNLLTAQKRMYAGKLLVDKKKYDLAFDTIEKSNNYFDDTLNNIELFMREKPKSADTIPFLDQFRTVTLKHSEVLEDLRPLVGKKYEAKLNWQETRVENIRKKVEVHLAPKQ